MGPERSRRLPLRPSSALAAVVLLLAGIATSCGTPARVATEAPAPPAAASSTSDALPVPFAQLVELDGADTAALHDAVEAAIAVCMTDAGFTYDPQPYMPATAPPPLFGNLDYAQIDGYGVVASLDTPQRADAEDHPLAWRQALLGTATVDQLSSDATVVTDTGGMRLAIDPASCASRARSAVYGDDVTWQRAKARLTYLQHRAYSAAIGDDATTDPVWADGIRDWRLCVNEQGYDLPAPLASIPSLVARAHAHGVDLDALRTEEIATATADATCVRQTGLADLARQRLLDAETGLGAEHPEPLEAYSDLLRAALERAEPGPG